MTSSSLSLMTEDTASPCSASVKNFWELLKPRVMSLVIFTAWVGLLLAPGSIHPVLAVTAIIAIAAGAGAAGCLNMWWEENTDSLMERTRRRPLPLKKIEGETALAFGIIIAIGSILLMLVAINFQAALWLAFTILFYVFIYTIYLKPRTDQSIVIGGLSGALPPLIGWVSVTGQTSLYPWILVAIIFFWTPAHFWSLCLKYHQDYKRAHLPMLPNTHGIHRTKIKIILYTFLTVFVSLLPYQLGFTTLLYFYGALILGVFFLIASIKLFYSSINEMKFFTISILYLFSIFTMLIVDHLI